MSLVKIVVRGTLLPSLFDAMKSCKSRGTVIGFTEHDMTFIGAEYSGHETEENLKLGMSFVLTKHSCETFEVARPIKRCVKIDDIVSITNTKIFKNKTLSKNATISLTINEDADTVMWFCITEHNGNTIEQSISCEETNTMPFQYEDTFTSECSRVIGAAEFANALHVLSTNNHRYCTIDLTAENLSFTGHGDGKRFAQANCCRICMAVNKTDDLDHTPSSDFTAHGTFEVADLQRFVKASLRKAYIYMETDKPLLIEYMLDTLPVTTDAVTCDRCTELDLSNAKEQAGSVIRYIIAEEEDEHE